MVVLWYSCPPPRHCSYGTSLVPCEIHGSEIAYLQETAALDARKEKSSESMRIEGAKEGSVQRISPGMGEWSVNVFGRPGYEQKQR